MRPERIAIHAITRNGACQAAKLKQQLPGSTLFVGEKFADDFPSARSLKLPLQQHFSDNFLGYEQHICFFSIGIIMRILAPLLVDKRSDPGVICIDEQARFCVPVLSGHRGGANAMALRVAELFQATPVLTTASDASETLSVDLMGAPFNWQLDPVSEPAITQVSAAVVNAQPVLIVQESGEPHWWRYQHPLPEHLHRVTGFDGIEFANYRAAIVISDRVDVMTQLKGCAPQLAARSVLWRPKSLVVGVGCDRNTPLSVLREGLEQFLHKYNLAAGSVAGLASIDLKSDETGLLALADQYSLPFTTYAAADLEAVKGVENPSETVKRCIGVSSVAEAAALYHADTNQLLVPKWKHHQAGKNMTLAACRRAFDSSFKQAPPVRPGVTQHGHGMRNEVVSGLHGESRTPALERPMLYYRHHLLLCSGKRCVDDEGVQLAASIRGLLKEMLLHRGTNRIKVTRTLCSGGCRNRTTAVIYQNLAAGEVAVDHALWLRNIDSLSLAQWRQIFTVLAAGDDLRAHLGSTHLAMVEPAPCESLTVTHRENHETI